MVFRKRFPLVLYTLCFLSLILSSCTKEKTSTVEDDKKAIRELIEQEVESLNAGDAKGLARIMTDDAVLMPPNVPSLSGKGTIQRWLLGFFGRFSVTVNHSSKDIVVTGDWAYEKWAIVWTVTPLAGGEPVTEELKGIHVFHKSPEGTWKIALDIWNSNNPQPSPL